MECDNVCKWWQRHPWGKWEIDREILDEHNIKKYKMKRVCSRCGDIELKTIVDGYLVGNDPITYYDTI